MKLYIIKSIKKLIKKVDQNFLNSSLKNLLLKSKYYFSPPKLYGIKLDITGHCNIDCQFCSLKEWYHNPGFISFDTIKRLRPDLENLTSLALSLNCEPLLHPELFQIIQYVKGINPNLEVFLTTNGILLNKNMVDLLLKSGLDKIFISIDSIKEEKFNRIRKGADFNTIINNLKTLIKERNNSKSNLREIGVITVSSKENVNELIQIYSTLQKIGIDCYIINGLEPYSEYYSTQILYGKEPDEKYVNIFNQIREFITRDKLNFRIADLKFKPVKNCYLSWVIIDWQGNVSPCTYLSYKRKFYFLNKENFFHPQIYLGNINKNTLKKIWNSKDAFNLKYKLAKGDLPEFCKHCLKNVI
ncbi:radical SAM protein [Candidatus Dependentiae bacterium]|nr:radical SAM protein [Candidatus Dependentiae bacterium]